MDTQKRTDRIKRITGHVLLISLVASAVYTLIRLFTAELSGMERSNITLMLVQCILGVLVMLLPSAIERKWSVPIPDGIYAVYYIFLYCSVFLGEVFSFYYRISYWDKVLHAFSGAMLGALGFILVNLLNHHLRDRVQLSPFFVALFAFSFALAAGAVWEVYEFTIDGIMGLNMQKYMAESGEIFLGRESLLDTMNDIITDAAAALLVSAVGYIQLKRGGQKAAQQVEKE